MKRYRRNLPAWLPILAVLCMTACSSVTVNQPLSDPPKAVDKEKFEGAWMADNEIVFVRFDETGIGHLAGVDFKDDAFQLQEGEFIVTAAKPGNLLTVRFRDNGKWGNYYLARYVFRGSDILMIWLPRTEIFQKAVESGTLKGTVEKHSGSSADVNLQGPPEAILKFVEKTEPAQTFEWEEPMILRRLTSVK